MEQTILALWEQMASPDINLINDAAQKIEQIFQSPDSIMLLFNISNSVHDLRIKRYSIINIYRLLKRHRDIIYSSSPAVFETYSQFIINLLESDIDIKNKIDLCDMLIENQSFFRNLGFGDYLKLAIQMLQNQDQNFYAIGVYLISHLIDGPHLPQFPTELFQSLINSCAQLLQQTQNQDEHSFDLFRICYSFLHSIIDVLDQRDELFSSFSVIIQYLQNTYQMFYSPLGIQNAFENQHVLYKVFKYFNFLASLLAVQPNYFAENFSPIIPEINVNLVNKNIDIYVRSASILVLSSAASSLPDLLESNLTNYIINSSLFAIELLEYEQDLNAIYRPNEIYSNICTNLFEECESSEIFGLFIPAISALSSMDDPRTMIAVFSIIDTIQQYCLDAIIDAFDDIQPLIIKAISTGNPITLEMASSLITSLCRSDSTIACNLLFSCEKSLLQFVQFDFVVNALREIYDISSKDPTDPNYSLTCLLGQLGLNQNQYHIEQVVECISYLMINMDSVEPEYFAQLHPFLIQLLQVNEISCATQSIFCFSAFAFKSPQLVKNDLPQIIQSIINGITQKDERFNQVSATTITNFVDIYPQTIGPFIPQLLASLISIIRDEELNERASWLARQIETIDDDDDVNQDDIELIAKRNQLNLFSSMRSDVFAAISVIFGVFATELAPQSDEILQIVMTSMGDDDDDILLNLKGFYQATAEIIPGFIKINKDPDQLIQLFLQSRSQMEMYENDIDSCVNFWNSLKIITSKCGSPFLLKYGNDILDIINEIFVNRKLWSIYSQTKKKFTLRKELINPITTLVGRFFHDFGGEGWLSPPNDISATVIQYAPKGIELMTNLIKTTKGAQAPASAAIAHIISSCKNNPQFDTYTTDILKIVFPLLINSKDGHSREFAYDTISILLYTGNNQAISMFSNNEFIQALLLSTQEAMQNEAKYSKTLVISAAILWCAVVMIYDAQITQEILELTLTFLPPPPSSPMLEFVAQFAVYAAQKWPQIFNVECLLGVGISIFASENFYIRNTKIEYMKMLAEILKNTPPEKIDEELNSDEHSLLTIHNNIQQVDNF